MSAAANPQAEQAYAMVNPCGLCPRLCEVNRVQGETGFCGIGARAVVASVGPHFGEEPPLVGYGGSGTIFFAGCNLGCVFCQNHDLSHGRSGTEVSVEQLVAMMLQLESGGCHNINFVTPTHVSAHVIDAVLRARAEGLSAPIVYNCGGYERLETLQLLDGVIEIYMPDAKYLDPGHAERYSAAPDYPDVMKAALKEMHRQVGDLVIENGVAKRGLLVRHLVMPNDVGSSREVVDFLADEISPDTYVNVMDQYRPVFRAAGDPTIGTHVDHGYYAEVRRHAQERGLRLAR